MLCIKIVCYHGRLAVVVEDRQKIYEMTGADPNQNYWQPWPWIDPYCLYLYSHHLTISFMSLDRTTILHGLYKQHSKPSNTSLSPCSSLSPLFFVFLRQVQQPSHSSLLRIRPRLPPTTSMEHSHQPQHRHPGSMLKEAASLTTLSTLSTTNSSFILGLQVFFMKSLGRNQCNYLFSTGVAISLSLT